MEPLKYRPHYPLTPFDSVLEARTWTANLVEWYNNEHRHSAIKFVTPAQRHAGLDEDILLNRQAVYEKARDQNPQRWSNDPRNWERVQFVDLNPDTTNVHQKLNLKEEIQHKMAA